MTTTERTIERTLDFDVPIERLWRAITDPTELSAWFGHEAHFEPTVGFEGTMTWENHGSFALRVEEVEAPHRLVWSWMHDEGVPFSAEAATTIEWQLSALDGGRSRLELKESGFRTEKHHHDNSGGWTSELGELVAYLS